MDIPGTSNNDTYQQWAHVVECPICYNIYDKPMQMGCGHTLCSTCIGRLVDQVKNNMAEELVRLPAHLRNPHLHNFDDPMFAALGGFNEQLDEPQFVDVPRMDPRDPGIIRGMIAFPPRRRNDVGPGATEIKCPECRKPTIVPVDGLPVNYRVQEIVQKVTPLFKDRHLVKHCKQCKEVLSQGVYFDCSQCVDDGHKICSTCAIRLHNGHDLVEKKALTSDDVRNMKQKINDASHVAFQALENIKPRLQAVGGAIEAKVLDKVGQHIKIFEFMLSSFDNKIKDTSTMDQLMEEVKKAERVSEVYTQAVTRVDAMLLEIENAVTSYWNPFETLQQEMGYQNDEEPRNTVQPAPNPVANLNPNPPVIDHAVDHLLAEIPAAMRAFMQNQPAVRHNVRAAAGHFAQVARQRNRVRQQDFQPGAQLLPQMQHLQQQRGVPGPPPHMQQRMWQQMNQMQNHMQPMPRPLFMGHPGGPMHQQMQQAVQPRLPPHPAQVHLMLQQQQQQVDDQLQRQRNVPNNVMNNVMNIHNQIQQMNQNANVPMPPQMPNPQHHQHQQRQMPFPPPQLHGGLLPPPNNQNYFQQQPARQQHPEQPQQPVFQGEIHVQQAQQIARAAGLVQQAVQEAQMAQQMEQQPADEAPAVEIPQDHWVEAMEVANAAAREFELHFNEPQRGEVEEEEPEDQQVVNQIGQNVENYRAGEMDVIHFEEVGVDGMQDVQVDDNRGIRRIVDDGMMMVPFEVFEDLRNEAEQNNAEVFEQAEAENRDLPAGDDVLNRALPAPRQNDNAIEPDNDVIVIDDAPVELLYDADPMNNFSQRREPQEEHERMEEDTDILEYNPLRRSQRRENPPVEVDTRRSTRRTMRNSNGASDEPSTSSATRSPTPQSISKRKKMEKKLKLEETGQMETEPADPGLSRKRRAPSNGSSSSSAPSTSSAPITRSQTRS